MTRIIVCDTGPLLHLSEAGVAHLLPLAGKILIPPLVAAEYEANTQGWNPPQWVQMVALENPASEKSSDGRALSIFIPAKQKQSGWLYRNMPTGC